MTRQSGHFNFKDGCKFLIPCLFYLSADRLSNFYIDVNNTSDGESQQCAHDTVAYEPSETRVYVCPSEIYGRFVRIRFDTHKTEHLQLCEVQVEGGGKDGFH